MVGVAGRSKACGTCRKRRVRCGLEQPQCSNCIKSDRFCTGYQRERIFIVNQTRHPGTFPKQPQQPPPPPPQQQQQQQGQEPRLIAEKEHKRFPNHGSSECTETAKKATTKKHKFTDDALTIPFWKQKHKSAALLSLVPSPATGNVSSLASHRQQLLALYVDSSIPSSGDFGPGPCTWIHYLPFLSDYPPCLAAAIDALVLSHVASLASSSSSLSGSGDRDLTHAHHCRQKSLQAYTTGLWHLQRALWSPSAMHLDSTLAACLLLAVYELLECPAGNRIGYISHQNGASRLIQLRGPEAHKSGFGHALFLAFRPGGILSAMEQHKGECFLAEREWMDGPWRGDERKGRGEEIWDWIALSPGVLARTDEMQRAKPVRSLCLALSVLEFCWKVDGELEEWYEELKEDCGGVLFWPVLVDDDDGGNGDGDGDVGVEQNGGERVFPVRYEFLNLKMAVVMMSYWSLLSVVYNGMMLLYQVLATVPVDRKAVKALGSRAPAALLKGIAVDCPADCACGGDPDVPCIVRFDVSSMPALEHRSDFMTPVRNICQSVLYCSHAKMKSLGWSSPITPLSIAVDVIKEYPWCTRERDWIIAVLRERCSRLPYLKNFWWAQDSISLEA